MLMAANLIGSVVLGFVAVLLGTALARGLAEPAIEQAAASVRNVEAMVAQQVHGASNPELPSISPRVDLRDGVGGEGSANDGSQP
jgi:hypothetical protein